MYICNFLDQLFHPYKFYVCDTSGMLFFIFASCEPLIAYKHMGKEYLKRAFNPALYTILNKHDKYCISMTWSYGKLFKTTWTTN